MFYINKCLLIKRLNKENLILIYGYIVTVLLFILCLHLFYLEPGELQFSYPNQDINSYMLNICINNFDIISLPNDNLYIRFAKFLINTDKVYTVPRDNYLFLNNNYSHLHTYVITNNKVSVKSTILKALNLKLKIEEECILKLENDYKLKLVDYNIMLAK